MARAISVHQLLNTKRKVLEFYGQWRKHIGCPEISGSMLIWGDSSQGKTSYALQFSRYIARFEKVLFNSIEEGDSLSMAMAFKRENMMDVANRVILLDKEPIGELIERLNRPKSQNVIIIDSLQYTTLTTIEYKELIKKFPRKLFVFVSHADGKEPAGKVAQSIKYDAHIKVRVAGFTAYVNSRYGGGEPYVISAEKVSRINPE